SVNFVIDNLRLVGPKGVLMLDDFENLNNWNRSDHPYSLTIDHTSGNTALQVHLVPGASIFYTSAPFNLTFSTQDYTAIEYDWKYVFPTQVPISFTFRSNDPANPDGYFDTLPGDVNSMPTIDKATTQTAGSDSFGEVDMSSYFTYDSSLKRQMVLTKEGVMVVRDNVMPGVSADGYNAGPIWYLYSQPDQQGANWFDSPGENQQWYAADPQGGSISSRSLLVYFDQSQGRTFGVEQGPKVTNTPVTSQAVFSKQQVTANQPVSFVTVLVPHDPSVAADQLAGGISVKKFEGNTIVSMSLSSGNMSILFAADGTEKVLRQKDDQPPVTTAHVSGVAGPGTWNNQKVSIQFSADDGNGFGVDRTEYSLDNGAWTTVSGAVYLAAEGIHTIQYRSVDFAGNWEQAKQLIIGIDKTPPSIAITAPDAKAYSDADRLTPQFTVADSLSGVDSIKTSAELDSQMVTQGTAIPLYTLPLGHHVFTVAASDLAGNTSSATVNFDTETSIADLTALVSKFAMSGSIDNQGIANSLQQKLKNGGLGDFINEVSAQSGKHITADASGYLLRDAKFLKAARD
ncbi:MAG: hypothetical protein JWN30_1011, partial [Bacilli bacterium]|nr:hypothetical protein [Bacilli bacterium]